MLIRDFINGQDERLMDALVPTVQVMSRVEALSAGEAVGIEEPDAGAGPEAADRK